MKTRLTSDPLSPGLSFQNAGVVSIYYRIEFVNSVSSYKGRAVLYGGLQQ